VVSNVKIKNPLLAASGRLLCFAYTDKGVNLGLPARTLCCKLVTVGSVQKHAVKDAPFNVDHAFCQLGLLLEGSDSLLLCSELLMKEGNVGKRVDHGAQLRLC
jgi:hypothetical protein